MNLYIFSSKDVKINQRMNALDIKTSDTKAVEMAYMDFLKLKHF